MERVRTLLLIEIIALFLINPSFSQKIIEGKSGIYSFDITKDVKPPIITIVEGSIKVIEPSGNNIIDATEICKIVFQLENTGIGDGIGLKLNVKATGDLQGISFPASKDLEILKVGKKLDVEIPVTANLDTQEGTITFSIKIDEPDGFGTDERQIEVRTSKFVAPMVEIVDNSVTGGKAGNLVKKYPFDLQVLVQNTQYGKAEDVAVSISLPQNVMLLSGNSITSIPFLNPGETKSIVYSLIVNDLYTGNQIPVSLKLGEMFGRFAKDKTVTLTLNQAVASNKIVVDGIQTQASVQPIAIASLSSAVDKNIPANGITHSNRYALIIGNEDYSSRQPGLSKEINVDFAGNDARVFKEYSVNTLGVPERQVKLLIDATAAEIRRELEWINRLAKLENGNSELIFYYSGHGLPDETSREPYLIPVDVSGATVSQGIKLSEVYQKLTEYPCQRVTVFLDACFSGGARNKELLAMKGMKVIPREDVFDGNMVVFTSSSGEESSGVYREKQHGYFTWFILKKLQETKGELTYLDMKNYLISNVLRETTLISKPQTPQVLVSPSVQIEWERWQFK